MTPESPPVAPEPEVVTSEPTHSTTAAFLFDEPNQELEASLAENGSAPAGAASTNDGLVDLAAQAAAAQTEVDPPVVITPEQEAAILTQPAPAAAPPAAPAVAPELAPIISPVAPVAAAAPVQQAAPSQDEINQQLNIYNLTEADYDAVFDTEDKQQSINALNSILQNAVRQAVTMSNVLVQEAQSKIDNQVRPYMQYADEQKHSMLEQGFYSKHKDLEASRPVVDAVLKQYQQSGQKFATPELLFDAVAQNTKAYLLQLQQLGQTAAPVTQGLAPAPVAPVQGKPRMAALPSGGQGGAGAGGGNSGKLNTAQSLFG